MRGCWLGELFWRWIVLVWWGGGPGGGVGLLAGEVGGGELEGLDEERGSFEVDVVAGEAGGEFGEGVLDAVAVGEGFDEEGVVLDDGGDVVAAVVEAHVLVVHGGGSAAAAVGLALVHALVGLGGFAGEIGVGGWHGRAPVPPPVGYHVCGGLVEVAGGCIRLGAGS
jgi:hypothetical protein